MYIYNYLSLKRYLGKIEKELERPMGFYHQLFLFAQKTRVTAEIKELNQISNN